LKEQGKKVGEIIMENLISKLKEIKGKIIAGRLDRPHARNLFKQARDDLSLILTIEEVKRLEVRTDNSNVSVDVKHYLQEIGYPADIIDTMTKDAIKFIESHLHSDNASKENRIGI